MTQCIKNSCYLRGRRGIVEVERGEESLIVTWTFVMVNQLFVFLSLILLQYSNCLCLAETSATQAVPLAGTRGTQRQEQASALQQAAGGGHPLSHFAPPRHHIGHGGRRDRWTAPPRWDHPHRNNGWRRCLALGCALHVPSLVGCALVCLLVAPWLGSLSNPWPVAASISVSRRDTNAETSAIAQPPWSETASNQNAQLWGGFYLPSRAFNCGTICTAQLEMQVDSPDMLNAFVHTHLHIESQDTKRALLLPCCNFEVWSSTDPWPWMVSEPRLEESVKKTKTVKGRQKK